MNKSTQVEIITDLYQILYLPELDNPESQYIPCYIIIDLTPRIKFTINKIDLQNLASLRSVRSAISDALNGKNIDKNLEQIGGRHWAMWIKNNYIYLTLHTNKSVDGCGVTMFLPCEEHHMKIFDMLIELRECINNKARFVPK